MLHRILNRLMSSHRDDACAENPRIAEPHGAGHQPESSSDTSTAWADLASRLPPALRPGFEATLRQIDPQTDSAVDLLDAIEEMRCGIGVAIGRGEVGQEQPYSDLGALLETLYVESGSPPNCRYAMLKRAAASLEQAAKPTRAD